MEDFRSGIQGRLENISKIKATVDDITTLKNALGGVKRELDEARDEQEEASREGTALSAPAWLSVVATVVVLLLAVAILLVLRRRPGQKTRTGSGAPP